MIYGKFDKIPSKDEVFLNKYKGEKQMANNVTMDEVNVDKFFVDNIFGGTIRYGEQCKGLNGVSEIILAVEEKNKQYMQERNNFVENRKKKLDKSLKTWKIFRIVFVVALILFICSLFSDRIISSIPQINIFLLDILVSIFSLILAFLFECGFIIALISFGLVKWAKSMYSLEINETRDKAITIIRKYENDAQMFYNRIDNIYLSSLEPAYRETILMRRDQERHHQEMLREQREHNRRLEEDQRRTRMAQEELLRIEREREERRRY